MGILSKSVQHTSLEQFVQLSSEPVVVHATDGKIVYYSKLFADLCGYGPFDLTQLKLSDILHSAEATHDELHDKEVHDFSGRLLTNSGNEVDVFVKRASANFDGQPAVINFVKEVYGQAGSTAINTSPLSHFPEENPNPVIQINSQKQIIYANKASQRILEVLHIKEGNRLPLNWREYIDEMLDNDEDPGSFEYPVGERTFLFKHSVQPKNGFIFIHGLDITDIKESRENLQRLNFELNNFLYRAHHDLKSPVSNMKGLIEMAATGDSASNTSDLLDRMKSTTLKMDDILNDLVKVIELNSMETDTGAINTSHLVEQLASDTQVGPALKEGRIHIIKGKDDHTSTDKQACFFLLKSLLSNALKYRDPAKKSHEVFLTISSTGQSIEISVQDNGPGIAREIRPYIFDMFYRGTNEVKGNGMGLYIVQKSLQKMNGKIGMSTKPGRGTTFHVSSPALT